MLSQQEWTRVQTHRCRPKRASRLIIKKLAPRFSLNASTKLINKIEYLILQNEQIVTLS